MLIRLKRLFFLCASGVLIGMALSCLIAILIFASKLSLFSKDFEEIAVTWLYMAILSTLGGLSGAIGAGALLVYKGKL